MTTLNAVEKKSDELYRKTLKSITSYESWIVELKKSLMEKYVLSKDEVFELLAPMITSSISRMQPEYGLHAAAHQLQ